MSRRYKLHGFGQRRSELVRQPGFIFCREGSFQGDHRAKEVLAAFYNNGSHLYFDPVKKPDRRLTSCDRPFDFLPRSKFEVWNRTSTGVQVRFVACMRSGRVEFDVMIREKYLELSIAPHRYLRFIDFGLDVVCFERDDRMPLELLPRG